ncbi:MAG: hypothetical protein PHU33_06370 [Bacteroidales bacterium]|nr:hypothetical protein [Bacteroidales bacterium]
MFIKIYSFVLPVKGVNYKAFTVAEMLVTLILFSVLSLLIVLVLQIVISQARLVQDKIVYKTGQEELMFRLRSEFERADYIQVYGRKVYMVHQAGDTSTLYIDDLSLVINRPPLQISRYKHINNFSFFFRGAAVNNGMIDKLILSVADDTSYFLTISKQYDASILIKKRF